MLDAEQIANWDESDADLMAADEYARRWRKGLPSDRFTDGHVGAVSVAKGIEKLKAQRDYLANVVASLLHEQAARNAVAMSPGEPEPKYGAV